MTNMVNSKDSDVPKIVTKYGQYGQYLEFQNSDKYGQYPNNYMGVSFQGVSIVTCHYILVSFFVSELIRMVSYQIQLKDKIPIVARKLRDELLFSFVGPQTVFQYFTLTVSMLIFSPENFCKP